MIKYACDIVGIFTLIYLVCVFYNKNQAIHIKYFSNAHTRIYQYFMTFHIVEIINVYFLVSQAQIHTQNDLSTYLVQKIIQFGVQILSHIQNMLCFNLVYWQIVVQYNKRRRKEKETNLKFKFVTCAKCCSKYVEKCGKYLIYIQKKNSK